MKKIIYAFLIVALGVVFYSFTANDTNVDTTLTEMSTTNEDVLLKTIDKPELNRLIEKNFIRFFDEVNYIDALYSEAEGYYFAVYGQKNNKESLQFLKVEKDDVDNETYTYFDFEGITITENTEYCYRGAECIACTYQPCCPGCNIICGPYPIACD
ncbi:MAG: hypothetical protein Aureis2KO_18700 [Aureisphaera sp.]